MEKKSREEEKMTFKIRTIEEKDIMETYEVIRNAFWDVYTPGCDEHYMVQQIRKVPEYIPELELVALDKDKIVGHVIFVKTVILTDQGKELEVISLGPIGVLPGYQRLGIGGQLIKTAIKRAQAAKFRAILLYGDPEIYRRKGFVPAETYGIRTADNVYMPACQIYPLENITKEEFAGKHFEHPCYQIDEQAAQEFDRQFSPRISRTGLASQRRFNKLIQEIRPFKG